jgi:signal transduction histidine kinase
MMRSLRTRLLAGVIGGMILLLTVFSLLLYGVIRSALVNQFDTSLSSVAQILAASVERGEDETEEGFDARHMSELQEDETEQGFDAEQMPELQDAGQPTYYQLWGPDGTVLAKSPLLGDRDLPRAEGLLEAPVFGTSRDEGGRPQRTVSLKLGPSRAGRGEENGSSSTNERAFVLAVARDAGDLQGQLRVLRWLLLLASVGMTTLSFLLGEWIVRRGLGPLNSIAAEIAAIRVDHLTTQIGAGHVPAEAIPIRDRLNELLSRLEAAFKRERQFNADVAHELRTPLAGIRSTIEVTLARHREATEYRTALCDCLEITQGMQSVVNRLLMLARLDARQISFKREPVRLAELVNSCWRPFADRGQERQIVFENCIPTETTCQSDPEHLSMVFSNLLDNAVEYADAGGRIWTTAHRTEGSAEITVSNTGCRLPPEQVSHVFDFFWRGDSSRPDTGAHCGLGLALVQRLVMALGGNTTAELQEGGVFTMRLILPITPWK